MTEFLGINPTLEDYWRSVILFGKNVASYKFALAKSLMELALTGKTFITLEELAEPFSRHITEHLKIEDKQTTSKSSSFLNVCRQFNVGEIAKEQLIDRTVKLGFNNVIDAFHNLSGAEISQRFFTDERQGTNRGIALTDELFQLLESEQFQSLSQEVEARWRLVETAWQLKISRNLVLVSYEPETELLFTRSNRRRNVTTCRDALNGYQKGKCFYCFGDISIELGTDDLVHVDHFFAHALGKYGIAQPIDGVWNLVLACVACNCGINGKFDRLPTLRYLERLHTRNEFLIKSDNPLKETLMQQTGGTETARRHFLQNNYNRAGTEGGRLIQWQPTFECPAGF